MSRDPIGRALAVLEAMNGGAPVSLHRITAGTNLPKSSVVRLLAALESAGYVRRVSRAAGYQATARTRNLACRAQAGDLVVEAAIEPMRAFTRAHRWPLFLATRDGLRMHTRFGTTDLSPYAVDPAGVGNRNPMLLSAVGRAYIAFCPPAERAALIAALRLSTRSVDRMARDAAALRAMLQDVRRKGYAETDEGLRRLTSRVPARWRDGRRRASGIAVPVMIGRRVAATLVMRHLPAALGQAEAAARFVPELEAVAKTIAAAASAARRDPSGTSARRRGTTARPERR